MLLIHTPAAHTRIAQTHSSVETAALEQSGAQSTEAIEQETAPLAKLQRLQTVTSERLEMDGFVEVPSEDSNVWGIWG